MIAEIILAFIITGYFFMRFVQKRTQKKYGLNNFEFWVYYNLVDYYKFNGYPYPEKRAKEEIDLIIERKNEECGITQKEEYKSIFGNKINDTSRI